MGLSTHILDTALGKPVAGVRLELTQQREGEWDLLGTGETDSDGRCRTLLGKQALQASTYKLKFLTSPYYASQSVRCLYPFVEIVFQVREPDEHYHIPLLLTANGYTTYRGS